MRLLRAPLLHFLAGGALLYVLVHGTRTGPPGSASRESAATEVVVTAADVVRLRGEYERETGLPTSPEDEAALVDRLVDEELLFREAVARGLDRNDRSVRNWLVEQMRVLEEAPDADPDDLYERARALGLDRTDLVVRRILVQKMRLLAARIDERPPTEEELRALYEREVAGRPGSDRITFWQVFFASSARGGAAPDDARRRLEEFRREGRDPAAAAREGDAFTVPPHVVGESPARIARLFGDEFAAGLSGAEAGAWLGPLPSAYGVHLVWIDSRESGAPPALDAVRSRLVEQWQAERRASRVAELLRDLKQRYALRVDSAAWHARRSG